ncbi:MAG: metallophosphoesterase [Eubacterium sp.]|nr:metallophosphoesterase [Eubacterium sp.]
MIYATSDLHGYPLDKFQALLDKAGFGEEDFLFVLGDVIDRGADGVTLLRWMMEQPNVQLILGNHEAMMLNSRFVFDTVTDESISRLRSFELDAYSAWKLNGATPTLDALRALDKEQVDAIFEYLSEAPLYETVTAGGRDFLLLHSGLRNFDKYRKLTGYLDDDFLWHRPNLTDRYFDDIFCVFGHTPTRYYGTEYKGRAIKTDTWINIDTGCGHGDMTPMVLRLDDMKEFYVNS